ncbi:MAG: PEP-utilizing enzyme, partial [Actinomycetota bacterium]
AYLTVEELRDALAGRGVEELADRVERRQGEEAWVRANPGPSHLGEQGAPPDISRLPGPLRQVNEPILWMVSHEYPPPAEAPDDDAVLVAGVPASAGVVEGPARIIRSHTELDRLQDGDVLVCQVTSPSWAPLFPLAAAVVADGGGALSHAAIASREHAIPAVLGTGTATTTLEDGQRIRVDGARGLVLAAD